MPKATFNTQLEKRLSDGERRVLADARAGKRNHDMNGWEFRIGRHGIAGRKAVQVRPWGHDMWLFVEWCTGAETVRQADVQTHLETLGTLR